MAERKWLANLNLNKNQLLNARVQNLGTAPSSPVLGQIYFDTVLNAVRFWDGTAWTNLATDSLLLQGQNGAYYLARGNHTGSQLASTISDFDTQVRTNRLDQMTAPTGSVSYNSQKITNLADGTNPADAVNLAQVQAIAGAASAGIDAKPSVRFLTTADITLSGLGTAAGRDWGSSLTAGDRILVKSQANASENGIYVAAVGSWTRATDCNSSANYTPQAFTFVEESNSTYAGSQWKVSTTGVFTVGTTNITWAQFGSSSSYTAGTNGGLQLSGNAFSILLPSGSGLITDATGLYIDRTDIVSKKNFTIGDGTTVSFACAHNLNSTMPKTSVREISGGAEVDTEVVYTDANTVTVNFNVAPTTNQLYVSVHA